MASSSSKKRKCKDEEEEEKLLLHCDDERSDTWTSENEEHMRFLLQNDCPPEEMMVIFNCSLGAIQSRIATFQSALKRGERTAFHQIFCCLRCHGFVYRPTVQTYKHACLCIIPRLEMSEVLSAETGTPSGLVGLPSKFELCTDCDKRLKDMERLARSAK